MSNPHEDLVTAKEAAVLARRDRRTISRWAESGRLPVALEVKGDEKVGARWFRRADVLALVGVTEAAS